VGLEFRWVRFQEPGRFSVAVVCNDSSSQRTAFVSQQAPASADPAWAFNGLKLDVRGGSCEVFIRFYRDAELAGDSRALLKIGVPFCSCSFQVLQADLAPQVRCLPLVGKQEGNEWHEIG
ncbi:unnamed protein product, partial [Polarella glacialis]